MEQAHDPAYVRAIIDGSVEPRVMRRIGSPWSPELVRRTLASVGQGTPGRLKARRHALGIRRQSGGRHPSRLPWGRLGVPCVFNDLAVAILALRHEGMAARAAVVDLDVHQGDGTAAIFECDPAVLTLSIHGANNFPFRKQRSGIDIALLRRHHLDSEYLGCLARVLPEVLAFHPDVVFYQSGVDALAEDRIGRLALSLDGLRQRDRMVLEATHGIPLVITLGGGYATPIALTAEAHTNTFREVWAKRGVLS